MTYLARRDAGGVDAEIPLGANIAQRLTRQDTEVALVARRR